MLECTYESAVGVKLNIWVKGVGEYVWVGPGVKVGVLVEELALNVTTNCGGAVPWREENTTPSLLSATNANVYVPFPVTKEVTSYSTQEFVPMAALLSTAPLDKAGRLFQVIAPLPDSIQLLFAK